jgi:hypothetical protein
LSGRRIVQIPNSLEYCQVYSPQSSILSLQLAVGKKNDLIWGVGETETGRRREKPVSVSEGGIVWRPDRVLGRRLMEIKFMEI